MGIQVSKIAGPLRVRESIWNMGGDTYETQSCRMITHVVTLVTAVPVVAVVVIENSSCSYSNDTTSSRRNTDGVNIPSTLNPILLLSIVFSMIPIYPQYKPFNPYIAPI